MSLQDPIADMLTCIRNGQKTNKTIIKVPFSKSKLRIISVLEKEGYIKSFSKIKNNDSKYMLEINLKYFHNKPVIETIKRISKPGLRVYKKKRCLPSVMSGFGVAIISTSKGVMTDRQARRLGIGGEVVCYVS